MAEFQVNNETYAVNRLPANVKFHLSRKAFPLFKAMRQAAFENAGKDPKEITYAMFESMAEAWSVMSEQDANFILDTCLAAVQRKQGDNWAKLTNNKSLMFEDAGSPEIMQALVWGVLDDQISPFSNTSS